MAKQMKSLDEAMNLEQLLENYSIQEQDAVWYIGTHKSAEGQTFKLFHLLVGTDPDTDENRYLSFGLSRKAEAKGLELSDDFIYDNVDEMRFLEAEDESSIGSMWVGDAEDPRHTGFKRG